LDQCWACVAYWLSTPGLMPAGPLFSRTSRGVVLALGEGLGTLLVTAATKHPRAEAKRRVRCCSPTRRGC